MKNHLAAGSSLSGFGCFLYHVAWQAADWLYPPICAGCGRPGTRWCDECAAKVAVISPPYCPRCGTPLPSSGQCQECRDHPPEYDQLRSWAVFSGPVRSALHQLKYRQNLGISEILARPLVRIVEAEHWSIDIIIPVPLSKSHLKQRGYNQAEAIAVPISLALRKKCLPKAVWRFKETSSQIALSAGERYQNLQGAFLANPDKLKDRNVLLLDDVATTGATLNSCSRALKEAGAKTIYCLTVAKTLRKRDAASVDS